MQRSLRILKKEVLTQYYSLFQLLRCASVTKEERKNIKQWEKKTDFFIWSGLRANLAWVLVAGKMYTSFKGS
jgi:hypothetical protein